ncbi:MAG TPA: NAD(P)H-dependent oxidoreductase [Smithellaceae bacterium]|nr:NAD(P)H-dependent oxidoreductase [Smithellaceae bacterium]
MDKYKIAVIIGSIRRDSFNRKLADAIVRLAPPDFTFRQSQISDLPLYNQDDDENQAASVQRLKSEIKEAQGLLFVTPEHNRTIPSALKNALDHGARPHGQNVWGGANRREFSGHHPAPPAPPWRNSIYAIFWPA